MPMYVKEGGQGDSIAAGCLHAGMERLDLAVLEPAMQTLKSGITVVEMARITNVFTVTQSDVKGVLRNVNA